MEKYYKEEKYNVAFERCINIMADLMQKYGRKVLTEIKHEKIYGPGNFEWDEPPDNESRLKRFTAYRDAYKKILETGKL